MTKDVATGNQVRLPAAGQERKRPTLLSINQTEVTIIVEVEPRPFFVYKDLFCHYSDYFRGTFEGQFRESEEKPICLEDIYERVFRLFQCWLYAQ
ncbi:hypothetical protein EJ02DRAFT_430261 [Clathrospora elynae]|uniref:BTB domain-containing protein n=1 Tax=Clathrospora elynae TaxID=706981 RepID=A0A6A5T5A6_9PLEO|nr:hypothetical protein EJ02DRAFT_430261 [Clathrospora elynae]